MNRQQRRAAHIKHRKPRPCSPKGIAAQLEAARPTEVYRFVLKRNSEGKVERAFESTTTDWAWLDDVEREGFDWHAPNGPTYYRVTKAHHASVFFHPKEHHPVLLISELEQEGWDEWRADNPEHAEANQRAAARSCPWLCLAYEISPEVAADVNSDEEARETVEMIRRLLKQGYDFALAHDLPLDKSVGLVVDDKSTGRQYLLHVMPDEQVAHLDYAPAGMHEQMRASPNFHYVH